MTSLILQAMDKLEEYLELVPEITTLHILQVKKKLKCSERWVWEAKKRLDEKNDKRSEVFSLMNEMTSDLKFYRSLFIDIAKSRRKLTAEEVREINNIDNNIDELDDKILIMEENIKKWGLETK